MRLLPSASPLPQLLVLALGLCLAVPAHAGPREDLRAALVRFLAQPSFQGDVQATVGGHSLPTKVEFQAPDRFRISRDGQVTGVIIGHDMYLVLHGRTIHAPTPASVDGYRDPALISRLDGGGPVQDLGLETVDGTPSHKYRVTPVADHPGEVTLWIGVRSGLPVQVQTTMQYPGRTLSSLIHYSHYGDRLIQISVPH